MSTYITGDIHCDVTRFSELYIPNESKLTEQDCIIVCGDFGLIWYNNDDYKITEFSKTILTIYQQDLIKTCFATVIMRILMKSIIMKWLSFTAAEHTK